MKLRCTLLAFVAAAIPLQASIIDLTFEGLQDGASVGNFYNGGTGGNYGITFSTDATGYIQTLINGQPAGSGFFGGESTAYTALAFCDSCATDQTADTVNVGGGFGNFFSLYYSAPDLFSSGGSVDIWSGFNGTGTKLATLTLGTTASFDATGTGNCDQYGPASDLGAAACPFVAAGVGFDGTAYSVVFNGANNSNPMFFDDLTFGEATPEPGTWLLIGSGLVGLVCARRFRPARG